MLQQLVCFYVDIGALYCEQVMSSTMLLIAELMAFVASVSFLAGPVMMGDTRQTAGRHPFRCAGFCWLGGQSRQIPKGPTKRNSLYERLLQKRLTVSQNWGTPIKTPIYTLTRIIGTPTQGPMFWETLICKGT